MYPISPMNNAMTVIDLACRSTRLDRSSWLSLPVCIFSQSHRSTFDSVRRACPLARAHLRLHLQRAITVGTRPKPLDAAQKIVSRQANVCHWSALTRPQRARRLRSLEQWMGWQWPTSEILTTVVRLA